ncbi:MAG TPA: LON peptidase substrate-binding domain-containing protein, partial [Myxococcota bacterium]|nr:LON peptidase substrate-binding domain-containing protein [Myxococcota bacterium]
MFGKDKRAPKSRIVPLLPLRDIIVFPHMQVPLFVGREKSIAALEAAMATDKEILLSAQKKAKTNDPTPDDIFRVGTLGTIMQIRKLSDGTIQVLVEGKQRAKIKRFVPNDGYFLAEVDDVVEKIDGNVEVEALMRQIQTTFESYVKLNKRMPPDLLVLVSTIDDPARLSDTIVAQLSLKLADKQGLLEIEDPVKRLERLYELMQAEIEILLV